MISKLISKFWTLIIFAVPQLITLYSLFLLRNNSQARDFIDVGTYLNIFMVYSTFALNLQTWVSATIKSSLDIHDLQKISKVIVQYFYFAIAICLATIPILVKITSLTSTDLFIAVLSLISNLHVTRIIAFRQANDQKYLNLMAFALLIRSFGILIPSLLFPEKSAVLLGILISSALLSLHFQVFVKLDYSKSGNKLNNISLAELVKSLVAILLMYTVVNIDLIWANRFLTQNELGIYVIGSVLAKIFFLAPQSFLWENLTNLTRNIGRSNFYSLIKAIVIVDCALLILVLFVNQFENIWMLGEIFSISLKEIIYFSTLGIGYIVYQAFSFTLTASPLRQSFVHLFVLASFVFITNFYMNTSAVDFVVSMFVSMIFGIIAIKLLSKHMWS